MEEFALRCSQTANGVVTLWGPNSRSRGNHCRLRSETRDETELFQLCEHARNWDRAAWIVRFAQTKSSAQTSSYKLDTKTHKPASGSLQVLLRFFGTECPLYLRRTTGWTGPAVKPMDEFLLGHLDFRLMNRTSTLNTSILIAHSIPPQNQQLTACCSHPTYQVTENKRLKYRQKPLFLI
jgi:hypothetical protein